MLVEPFTFNAEESLTLETFRQQAAEQSQGKSSSQILNCVLSKIHSQTIAPNAEILDVGCGAGDLIAMMKRSFSRASFTGCDYTSFDSTRAPDFEFLQHDCNIQLPFAANKFDLIVSSEVIEHLESPRFFIRELARVLKPGGILIVTTPNIESYTSILSFIVRGYHSSFGGSSYPAHITAVASYDLRNMMQETGLLNLLEIDYVPDGRIPGTSLKWQSVFGPIKGKRVSDNYLAVARKLI